MQKYVNVSNTTTAEKKYIYMCSEGKGKQLKILTDYVW